MIGSMNAIQKVAQTGDSTAGHAPGSGVAGTVGAEVVRIFAQAGEQARQRAHASGRPYSTAMNGGVVFVHPDGSVRFGRDPASPLAT